MSRYKLVIFDLDGVICNTDIYHFLAWKKIVEDSDAGVQAALSAGMDCAAIGRGVKYSLAKYNLSNFEDLLYII